jgi:hypothetical protein
LYNDERRPGSRHDVDVFGLADGDTLGLWAGIPLGDHGSELCNGNKIPVLYFISLFISLFITEYCLLYFNERQSLLLGLRQQCDRTFSKWLPLRRYQHTNYTYDRSDHAIRCRSSPLHMVGVHEGSYPPFLAAPLSTTPNTHSLSDVKLCTKLCGDEGRPSASVNPNVMRLASQKDSRWSPGDKFSVDFIGGTILIDEKVRTSSINH